MNIMLKDLKCEYDTRIVVQNETERPTRYIICTRRRYFSPDGCVVYTSFDAIEELSTTEYEALNNNKAI